MTTGAGLMLSSPATIAPPFLGLWPLLGALLGRDAASDAARVRAAHGTRHLVVAALLGYADAIQAGRQGRADRAEAAFAAADRQMGPLVAWYRQYARRLAAERMFLSPRTVEKHVASLLAKTGLRRAQLGGYSAGLDG
jgi:hypothetical protein